MKSSTKRSAAAVITFPGSNCDDDCVHALRLHGFDVTTIWHKETASLDRQDLVVLPGGFSYGDYLRSGAMAAKSPIVGRVIEFAEHGGLVLGICNGFQILCETGLLPGALARNHDGKFVCREVSLVVERTDNPWFSSCETGQILRMPIAHGEGRYLIEDDLYAAMNESGQILLRYDTETVANPNGSAHAIAGVCNSEKNVFGLMPHPERASELRSQDGAKLWSSILGHLDRPAAKRRSR